MTAEGLETASVVGSDPEVAIVPRTQLRFDHAYGGGPGATDEERVSAARFGLVNAMFHADRAMTLAAELTGRPLPRLRIRIGVHHDWGGGHYRLPAPSFSDRPENLPLSAAGEIHLGRGRRFLEVDGRRYYNAPSHNAAIVYHEVGHHLCRHTADFRLNHGRPPLDQTNAKTPLDEGTADYFAATLLGYPDIYGWNRSHVPRGTQGRRHLDAPWTMADFRGGHDQDPHTDGSVWAAAMWEARIAAVSTGAAIATYDRAVGAALVELGTTPARSEDALRERRYFSRFCNALVANACAVDNRLGSAVRKAFESRGITGSSSNAVLRDRSRRAALSVGASV